jgi:EamA domain-containing membrane protein RarD
VIEPDAPTERAVARGDSTERARHRIRRGVEAAVVAYLVWGALTIFWKELQRFDPFELIGWRIISAANMS